MVALPFVLRVGRGHNAGPGPYARLLTFFLGFGAFFVWLAIAVEGLFYVAYSLTLCLWVEVEAARRRWPWGKWEVVERSVLGQTGDGVRCGALEFGGSYYRSVPE